jgi:hypothetical protein
MVYEKHHIEKAPDREGKQRDAIVFELRPLILAQLSNRLKAALPLSQARRSKNSTR